MKKIGLCFCGGGARGAYQIGAVKALIDLGIYEKVNCFSGTSIGAVNSVLLASNQVEVVMDLWFNISQESLKNNESLLTRLSREKLHAIEKGIFTMDTLEEVLLKYVKYDKLIDKEIYITVSEIENGDNGLLELAKSTYNHYFKKTNNVIYINLNNLPKNEIVKNIIASCSIPIVFPAVIHNNKKYYDGGVFDNIPVKPLVEANCDEIIVLHLFNYPLLKTKKHPNILFHQIKHKGGLGRILNFNSSNAKKLFNYGYEDTMNYFNNLS